MNASNISDFSKKLKEFDLQSLLSENTNLKVMLSSLRSESEVELQVLKSQNKEYCEILKNIQEKTNKHYMEIQQVWEKKYFALETRNKKLEIELEKTQGILSQFQENTREKEILMLKDKEKYKIWTEEINKKDSETNKWMEKHFISEERIKDLLVKNELIYTELQKHKKVAEMSEIKLANYLDEFQRKVFTLEDELQKFNIKSQSLQAQNENKQKQIERLQTDLFEYKEKLSKMQENSHSELNLMIKDFQENYNKMRKKVETQNEEIEKLKMLNKQYQQEIGEVRGYYGNLMGSLQDNIRQNIKETLKTSKFSTPTRNEYLNKENYNEKIGIEVISGKSFDGDLSTKFIHKYQ